MTTVGELVGRGRTSDVFEYGTDSVIKIPHASVPADWPRFEAELTAAVKAAGAPAPAVRDVVVIDGRSAAVFERIRGQSLWQQMCESPHRLSELAKELVAIHRSVMMVGLPVGPPDLVDRTRLKIIAAERLSDDDRHEGISILGSLPRGAALLHGDLHPGNVLMSDSGPIVIDWFDAAIGHPVADIVRSALLVRPSTLGQPRHLPGATFEMLDELHQVYRREFSAELSCARAELANWQAVVAASRLQEQADVDERALVELWQARSAG